MKKASEWIKIIQEIIDNYGDVTLFLDRHNWPSPCESCRKAQWPDGGHRLDPRTGMIGCDRTKEEIT